MTFRASWVVAFGLALALGFSCREEEPFSGICRVSFDCYPGIDPELLSDERVCLKQVQGGYCTHLCNNDADCCAAEGECDDADLPRVCAPYGAAGLRMCFYSCADNVIEMFGMGGGEGMDDGEGMGSGSGSGGNQGPMEDPAEVYCRDRAHPNLTCQTQGMDPDVRKVCLPSP